MMSTAQMKKLGIIAAPGWFDPTLSEFVNRHGCELHVTQTILTPAGFDYSFDAIRQSGTGLEIAACQLAEAGVDFIAQVGPAFAYLAGGTPAGAKQLQQHLSDACGVSVILNGVAVFDALERIGATNLAVACPYYSPDWKIEVSEYIRSSGYTIQAFQTFVEQGLFNAQEDVAARAYKFSDEEVIESVRRTSAAAQGADAIMIGGSGVRTHHWLERVQAEVGIPIVSADSALYQSVVKGMGLGQSMVLPIR